jgi:hypothetical protein
MRQLFYSVRMEGLEPPHLAASDPKSDVSTNFTTCAYLPIAYCLLNWGCKHRAFLRKFVNYGFCCRDIEI